MPHINKLGQAGEKFAVAWLIEQGFQIIKCNYFAPGGEIDVIVWDAKTKCVLMVEVKTRKANFRSNGIAAINSQKVRRMKRAAEHYFFKTLDRKYAPDFEFWGLAINKSYKPESGVKYEVIDFLAVG